jgi:hypothetical protein
VAPRESQADGRVQPTCADQRVGEQADEQRAGEVGAERVLTALAGGGG